MKLKKGYHSMNKMKKKRALAGSGRYTALFVVLIIFTLLSIAIAIVVSFDRSPSSPNSNDTAAPLDDVSTSTPSMDDIQLGDVFEIASADELKALAASGSLNEFCKNNGSVPAVIIPDGITFDSDISIDCGVELIFLGNVEWANGAKLNIRTSDTCEISLATNENIENFNIDAPNASLVWSGGDIPFSYEVARYMNVASFNGSDVTDNGDKLGGLGTAEITGINLYTNKSKSKLADATYTVTGNVITLYYPWDFDYSDIKNAYLDVVSDGNCTSDTSNSFDLSKSTLISVSDENGNTRTYRLNSERRSYGIPILSIDTSTGKAVNTREEYIASTMTIDGEEYSLGIKGRGNASWHTFPKKSYRLKLDEKAKLLGMPADRDWVLVSNYGDPSLIRNHIASDMAKRLDGLDFTATHVSVDLYINGEYLGVYAIAQKLESAKNKVNLGDPITDENGNVTDFGFLIEFGWDYSSDNVYKKDYFDLDYAIRMYIKEPEIEEKNNSTFKYIYNYVSAAEKAIVSGDGWQDYIDIDSWVDWFIINEFGNNTESAFHRSFFMYKPAGGKLTAGPIWDYDMAFGNFLCDLSSYNKGWVAVDSTYEYVYQNWMYFLLRDDYFASCVKARWAEVGETLYQTALESLDKNSADIKDAAVNNFKLWNEVQGYRVGLSRASMRCNTWEKQIEYIRNFLEVRYNWMDKKLSGDGSILN